MVNQRQQFIATVDNQLLAALIHDIVTIQSNGLDVKTNFTYTKRDLMAIITANSFMGVRNIVGS